MSAAAAIAGSETAGLRFRLSPDRRVRMDATAPSPAEVQNDLRRWRDDVAVLVARIALH